MHAYTADFRPLFEDEEAHFASQVAQHLNIPHTVLSEGGALPFEDWKEPSLCTPEPCVEPYLLSNLRLYRKVATLARVVLSGDGGDDILTGETWPYLKFLVRQRRLFTLASSFGGYFLKHARLPPLRAGIRARLLRWTGQEKAVSGYPEWLDPAFEKMHHLRERWESLGSTPAPLHPVHPGAYATLSGTFWASVMEDEDAAWTGVPVERRAPFLDVRVIRFLLRLPTVPFCIQKTVLREVLKGRLPEEVRRRPKTPLAQDPFALHVERGWSPLPLPPAVESVRHYVQWEKLTATSSAFRGSSLWGAVRPVSLNHWLKGVEKKNRIQYSR
jgi:asparagine synthase (glutamine-hydrolysing)